MTCSIRWWSRTKPRTLGPDMNVLFHSGDDLYSRAIQAWTWCRASHCEIELDSGVRFTALPKRGPVYRMPLMPGTLGWRRVRLQTLPNHQRTIDAMSSMIGCRYDWPGIFLAQALHLHRDARSRWFCSEACFHALNVGGLWGAPSMDDPSSVSPRGLLRRLKTTWDQATPV